MAERGEGSASTRISVGAWLVLSFALLLLLLGTAQLLYRYTLPTDGWSIYTEEIAETNFVFDRNLVGAVSDLQAADVVLAVEGVAVAGEATSSYIAPPPGWRAGQNVTMLIRRDGEQVEVSVPVVQWTVAAAVRHNAATVGQIGGLVGVLLLTAVGWFTFSRRPEVPSARALLILSTVVGVTAISGMLPDGLSTQFDLPAFWLTAFFSYVIYGTALAPALLTFTLLFPQPKQVIQRHPWLAALPLLYGGLLFLFLLAGGNPAMGWYSTMAMFALSIGSLVHAWFTQRDPTSRTQLRWALSSLVLGLGLFMLNFVIAFGGITDITLINVLSALASQGMLVIGLGLAVAVLRYRLYDIDVILRKTLVYAVLSGLLLLLYFGSVVLLQSLVGRTADGQSPLIIVISTLLIAAMFAPLRERVQASIDRRFFRKKYDAQQVLAQFAQTARDETDIDMLNSELAGVVQDTMQPEGVSVWLREPRP